MISLLIGLYAADLAPAPCLRDPLPVVSRVQLTRRVNTPDYSQVPCNCTKSQRSRAGHQNHGADAVIFADAYNRGADLSPAVMRMVLFFYQYGTTVFTQNPAMASPAVSLSESFTALSIQRSGGTSEQVQYKYGGHGAPTPQTLESIFDFVFIKKYPLKEAITKHGIQETFKSYTTASDYVKSKIEEKEAEQKSRSDRKRKEARQQARTDKAREEFEESNGPSTGMDDGYFFNPSDSD